MCGYLSTQALYNYADSLKPHSQSTFFEVEEPLHTQLQVEANTLIDPIRMASQLKYVCLFPDNAAILSGKKIERFYTISEMQAARNLYFQYVNYQ